MNRNLPGEGQPSSAGGFLRFAGLAAALTLVLVAVGYLPTLRLGGPEAIPAMLAGCGVSLVASAVGVLPLLLAGSGVTPQGRVNRILGALALRLAVVLLLGAGAALSGLFSLKPLLLWIAFSYMALLAVDTAVAVRGMRQET